MKTCKTCGVEKPTTEFTKNAQYRDRLHPMCKECRNAYMRERKKEVRYDRPAPTERVCRKCGETKPLDEFYEVWTGRYGRAANCKSCARAVARGRYTKVKDDPEYRERVKGYTRRFRERHPEKAKGIHRAYYERNREAVLAKRAEQRAEWRARDPEGYKAYHREMTRRSRERKRAEAERLKAEAEAERAKKGAQRLGELFDKLKSE